MGRARKRRSVGWRVLKWGALLAVLFAIAAVILLRVSYNGPKLASLVQKMINERIRGQVKIGSIEWPLGSLHKVVVGGWIPVDVYNLEVYDDTIDPETGHGRRLLTVPHLRAKIDSHSAIFGRHDLVLDDIEIPKNPDPDPQDRQKWTYALIRQVPEPFPSHEYDDVVVSLISAFYSKRTESFYAGVSAAPKRVFDLRRYDLNVDQLELEFPGFHANLYDVEARDGFLYSDGSDPLSPKLYYSLKPRAQRGVIEILDSEAKQFQVSDVVVSRLSQLPDQWPRDPIAHDVDFDLAAQTEEGGHLTLEGSYDNYWDNYFGGDYHKVKLDVTGAGPLAAKLSDGLASGDDLQLLVKVSGPALGPRFGVDIKALQLAIPIREDEPPLDLYLAQTSLGFDMATETGTVEDTVARGAGGEVQLAAECRLNPFLFDAQVDLSQAIQVGPYLPPDVAQLAGTRLRGHLHARGNGDIQEIDNIDLWLGRAHLLGKLYHEKERIIHADQLRVSLGKTDLNSKGWVDLAKQRFDLDLRFDSGDAARFLHHFRAPEVASSLSGSARVAGSFDNPHATAMVTAGGVPAIGSVTAKLAYQDRMLSLLDASSRQLGGKIDARGKIQLGGRPRILAFTASATDLDLSRVPGAGSLLSGVASAELEASGPFARLKASGGAQVRDLVVAGDDYKNFTLTGRMDPDGTRGVDLHVTREAGGKLDLVTALDERDQISGVLSLRGLPLETLGFLKAQVGGTLDTDLRLGGTPKDLSADGTISLVRAWFGQAFLGAANLTIDREGDRMRLRGHLFQDKLRIDGTLTGSAPYLADLELRVKRLEFDQFFPELAERYRARGWITGTIRISTALLPGPHDHPEISCDLSEVMLVIANEDTRGRPAPLRLSNRKPIRLAYDGTTATLTEDAVIRGPTGDFVLSGSGSPDKLGFHVKGDVAVQLLEPYLRDYFDQMSGKLTVQVDVTGSADNIEIAGTVDIDKVAVTPAGQEAVVAIDTGKLQITNDQLAVTGITVSVSDTYGDEHAELTLRGGVKMKNFVPELWALQIEGQLAGKMLLVAAPSAFSAADGVADVTLSLHGIGQVPNIDGSLNFATDRPLAISPRGVGHEITLNRGILTFTDNLIDLGCTASEEGPQGCSPADNIAGLVDGEGKILGISGAIDLENWQPVGVDVTGSAEALSFRVPEQLDVTLNLTDVRVVGGVKGLDVTGAVDIVDGRYKRDFNMVKDVLVPARTEEASTPFYKENPLLANANLDLNLGVRGFYVDNNVADVELNGSIAVTGTPADPKFDGEIRVEQGTFKFPLLRPTFTRTSGSVTFLAHGRFPEDTPVLAVKSESDFRDTSGQEHQIFLELNGTLENLNWDLYTASGLNKAQTMSLVALGRTTEEVRQSLGDQAIGNPNDVIRTTAEGNVYDEVVKDVAGDFISMLVEDKLKAFTKLDVARLEVGTSSFGFHGEKNFFKNLRALGDYEKTTSGVTIDVRGEFRVTDGWSLETEFLDKNYYEESEEDLRDSRLRAVWRWEGQ